jgi:hypothetical protein
MQNTGIFQKGGGRGRKRKFNRIHLIHYLRVFDRKNQ